MMTLTSLRRFLVRWIVIAAVWWIISEGDGSSLWLGALVALAAAALSMSLRPDGIPGLSPLGALRFAGYFLVNSVLGGVDVAMRALKPSMPIDPRFVSYPLRLTDVSARVLFANTLSLLPGTLSAQLSGDTLVVHALDCSGDVIGEIAQVEERVAGVFGIALAEASGGAV